ncbi:hypothetical protein K503DRAFT_782243 [Rhizopogon vinicolor AM-OR11-026]|uniref:Uncharacterized protein n=1 Tax=Rhizopogon vinicolor AM-OR11-026 TaxID=1314800 RepID=A0A1B7N388_9AGAM|nr:hypothetical protein K503DRAFT_782243 [Rhizopogon vinicolor AM-OR11-026]
MSPKIATKGNLRKIWSCNLEKTRSVLRTWFGGSGVLGDIQNSPTKNLQPAEENGLERNVIAALNSTPLATMRKFAIRAHRFIDVYDKGLDGRRAACSHLVALTHSHSLFLVS